MLLLSELNSNCNKFCQIQLVRKFKRHTSSSPEFFLLTKRGRVGSQGKVKISKAGELEALKEKYFEQIRNLLAQGYQVIHLIDPD
jgi:hypothetical protein